MNTFWELVCTTLPGKGCDCVLAGLEKLFDKIAAYTSRSLDDNVLENAPFLDGRVVSLTPTIATFSMRLVKPAGWSLAYFGDIVDR